MIRRKTKSVAYVAALLAETSLAGLASRATAQEATSQVEEVVVTGTRLANRTVTNSPVPIDVLTAAELTRSGHSGAAPHPAGKIFIRRKHFALPQSSLFQN